MVSGSFEDVSGELINVDAVAGKITLKDLATKKMMTVDVTGNTDVRKMPPMVATRFAAQANGGAGAAVRRGCWRSRRHGVAMQQVRATAAAAVPMAVVQAEAAVAMRQVAGSAGGRVRGRSAGGGPWRR